MLLSVIKYFKGYVYVRLSGYAPERFLNLCGSHDILIWNLKSTKDGYEFCISVAGFKQLRPILKKTRTHTPPSPPQSRRPQKPPTAYLIVLSHNL